MNIHPKIPVPVTFNPHKHHFGFLKEQIDLWQKQEWETVEKELLLIGGNLLDLYLGELSVENVCEQCIRFFRENKLLSMEQFLDWLHPAEYRKIELADNSLWVIKKGDNTQRYIHIHPAKNSPHSIRVRATTLKTVLALNVKDEKLLKDFSSNLAAVNETRTRYLGLSPVKKLEREKGIARLWSIFNSTKQGHQS